MGHLIHVMDDSYAPHRTLCAPYLRQKGITGGFAMIPGQHTGNDTQFMNVQQAREVQDVYGHECYTHACTLPDHDNTSLFGSADNYVAGEVSVGKAKRLMVAQGLNVGNTHDIFVAPPGAPQYGDPTNGLGTHTALARHFIARCTFLSGYPQLAAGTPCETVPPMNLHHIRRNGWNGNTVAQTRAFISLIRQNPYAVGVLTFHNVIAGGTGVHTTPANWQAVVDEIAFQRDNNYQSDLAANTAGGKLTVSTLSQLVRGQLAPTL